MTSPPSAVQLTNLSKTYRRRGEEPVQAVKNLDLTVKAGEIMAFLGPNGAGKSTTIDMILGLIAPTSGDVSVLGMTPRAAINAGRITAVMQSGGLLPDLSIEQTVQMIASTYRWPAVQRNSRATDVINQADLTAIANRRVSKCSGGEQQRLRFALALLPDPDIIILDEPTAGMDVTSRRTFWAAMHQAASSGHTIVFATHYLEEAEEFANRTVMVAHGEIVADGVTDDLRAQFAVSTMTATLAEPELPAFRAELLTTIPGATVDWAAGTLTVKTPETDQAARLLLTTTNATGLEISQGSLDDAFISLTSEGPQA